MAPICATVLLAMGFANLPAGTCILLCEQKRAFIAVEDANHGKAMTGDGNWFHVWRVDGKWYSVMESELEQCQRGG